MISEAELQVLEDTVVDALRSRDDSRLNVIGYGEVAVALGWPSDEPTHVCKRTPPFTRSQFPKYASHVVDYTERLRATGLNVVPTQVMSLERGDSVIGYLVQPLLDSASLGHKVLGRADPSADHPFLAALAEAVGRVTPTLSIDAQVTNFSWDGTDLTLVDVGTPFIWDESGSPVVDLKPMVRMLPGPTRYLAARQLTTLADRWRDPRRVAIDIVANLHREGLDDWVAPTVTALNRDLSFAEPITADEGLAFYQEDLKFWPVMLRLQRVERAWQERVRRHPYDWFIQTTF